MDSGRPKDLICQLVVVVANAVGVACTGAAHNDNSGADALIPNQCSKSKGRFCPELICESLAFRLELDGDTLVELLARPASLDAK